MLILILPDIVEIVFNLVFQYLDIHLYIKFSDMKLSRASPEDKINICRKYFFAGIPLLPWVWVVNVLWFWTEATKTDHIPEVSFFETL